MGISKQNQHLPDRNRGFSCSRHAQASPFTNRVNTIMHRLREARSVGAGPRYRYSLLITPQRGRSLSSERLAASPGRLSQVC